jgi:hypothetical protein
VIWTWCGAFWRLPWHPDNSIQHATPRRGLPVLGSQQAVELLADF